jgi:Cft2 family RNA processing exonuclease
MEQLADDVWHLPLGPRDSVNAYALAHAHLNHSGGSAR